METIESTLTLRIHDATRGITAAGTPSAIDTHVRKILSNILERSSITTHAATRAVIYAALEHVLEELSWKP